MLFRNCVQYISQWFGEYRTNRIHSWLVTETSQSGRIAIPSSVYENFLKVLTWSVITFISFASELLMQVCKSDYECSHQNLQWCPVCCEAVGRSEHRKRFVTLFPSLLVWFFSFIICLHKILVGNRCHSSGVNHFKSLTVRNNLFNLPVRNYGVGYVNVSRITVLQLFRANMKRVGKPKIKGKPLQKKSLNLLCL